MSKIYNYMFMTTGIIILLELAGIKTGVNVFKDWVGLFTNGTFSLEAMFDSVAEIITAGGIISGIVIGFLIKSSPESAIVTPFASALLTLFVTTFMAVIGYVQGLGITYLEWIVYAIFTPIMVSFLVALINFWRGAES